MNTFNKNNTGFTLVETLVAISIFTISILAIMSILSTGISNTGYAKKKITASYLAQEGIEHMRNMRDTYVLYSSSASTGWNAFITKLNNGSCQVANGCYFNPDTLYTTITSPMEMTKVPLTACGASCVELLYDSLTGKYGYTTGVASGFIRKINITQVNANEIKITSTVYWAQGSGLYNIPLSESLYNWVE